MYAQAPTPYAPRAAVGLNAAATSHAWKSVGLAFGAFLLSLVILAIGALTGILLIIGIPLFLGACIAIPFTIWRLFDPTKYGTLRWLAPTSQARRQVLDHVDADISRPDAWQMRCGSGALFMTASFLVYKGSSVEAVRSEDVVWWWEKRKGSSMYVCVKTRQNEKFEMEVNATDTHVPQAFARAFPFAYAGYAPHLDRCSGQQLAYEVDRQRAAAHGAAW